MKLLQVYFLENYRPNVLLTYYFKNSFVYCAVKNGLLSAMTNCVVSSVTGKGGLRMCQGPVWPQGWWRRGGEGSW